jgi:hypothetical protein
MEAGDMEGRLLERAIGKRAIEASMTIVIYIRK